jgi:dolichyl-phosphate-mannose-protein mannosyltransferase
VAFHDLERVVTPLPMRCAERRERVTGAGSMSCASPARPALHARRRLERRRDGAALPVTPAARTLRPASVAAIFAAAALLLYLPRLAVPPVYIYDEVYHAYTAAQYVAGNADAYVWYTHAPEPNAAYTWNHPPLGLWCIAAGIRVFGNDAFGWRIAPALFGALGIALTYVLALRTTGRSGVAVLASGLVLMDGLWFVQSRTAMLDVFGAVFLLAAMLALEAYLRAPADRTLGPLAALGLFLGLGIAVKWNAAYPAAFAGLAVITRAALARRAGARAAVRLHLWAVPSMLVVLPAAVYLAAYVPFFVARHTLREFVELERQTWWYHAHLTATHAYQSRWWEWPLALRPVWYHVARGAGTVANTYANGNPALFWAFLPAVGWMLYQSIRDRSRAAVVVAVGFLGTWVPWILVSRIAFVYHFLPAVPFGAMAVAWSASHLASRGTAWRALVSVYLFLVVATFAFFYPIWSSVPLSEAAFNARMWIASWR